MPLVSSVGRKSLRSAALIGVFYVVLCLGGVTMVYPFALMVSSSICSYADYHEFTLVPRYLFSEKMLFKKYIVDKCKTNFLGYEYGHPWYHPIDIKVEAEVIDQEKSEIDVERTNRTGKTCYIRKVTRLEDPLSVYFEKDPSKVGAIASDWDEFLKLCPNLYKFTYFTDAGSGTYTVLDLKPEYREWLKKKYGTIQELNRAYVENADEFSQVSPPYEDPLRQRWVLPLDSKYADWAEFKRTLPAGKVRVVSAEMAFQKFLVEKFPMMDDLRKATGLGIRRHSEISLFSAFSRKLLADGIREEFIKKKCPVIFLKLDPSMEPAFKDFIEEKYRNFSKETRDAKLAIKFSPTCPMDTDYTGQANEWIEFMEKKVPAEKISFEDPALMYQSFLIGKYGGLDAINARYGSDFRDAADIRLPSPWIDIHTFRASRSAIFWKYLTGNYMMVFNVIAVHGRALFNTIVFVVLAIACALTVNPLAAYALSRYKLSYTNKIMLFLLATMAFPHSVGMIPSFLLLKDLGLLNTFAALVLPGLANGYSIFLLKGFFDSLPSEMYEAALIDGASEITIFCRMAVPMTKPILAIIALGAFTHAYSAFMFAFLTCQDPKMWTLMVFLYEFQQNYPNYLVMASLVVSAVPTLLVFVFCQNIILKGIVVPSFK